MIPPATDMGPRKAGWRAVRAIAGALLLLLAPSLAAQPPQAAGQAPYGGAPWAVPGTIQVEDYDLGGEGTGYHDATAGNDGGDYRTDDVDILITPNETLVGWIAIGDWTEYTVDVAQAGTYDLEVRFASPGLTGGSSGPKGRLSC